MGSEQIDGGGMKQIRIGPWRVEDWPDGCIVDGQLSEYDFETTCAILEDRLNDPMDKAARVLGKAIQPDGRLYDISKYLSWVKGNREATLDGRFTSEELFAIATWMRSWENATPLEEFHQEVKEVDRLNQMLRDTGYGQGQIDAYVAQCEMLDQVRDFLEPLTETDRGSGPIEVAKACLAEEILEILS